MKYFELASAEKKILNDFEKGELVTMGGFKKRKKDYQRFAAHTLKKTKNINLRLSQKDLIKLKARAVQEGMPYQTLAASILHRFTNSHKTSLLQAAP